MAAEVLDTEIEAALNPAEAEGTFRDTRECAALALVGGAGQILLSRPLRGRRRADGIDR
ncbi:hypothetical protein NKH77_35745 [Streptomyces sp. M19]